GSMYAQTTRKDLWIRKVRALRKMLRNNKFRLDSPSYRKIYGMVSGNAFKGKKQLLEFIQKNESSKT
ncbi:MAG: 50S ribosomal protein L19e, partial [Candidatus Micrarchaeota archaeon]